MNQVFSPVHKEGSLADSISDHAEDLLEASKAKPVAKGRAGNQVAVSVLLPEKRAREMAEYFEKHPDMVRPFFVAGGLELMAFHKPPPFESLDTTSTPRPIQLRVFKDRDHFQDKEIL